MRFILRLTYLGCIGACLAAGTTSVARAGAATTQPTSSVTGTITAESEVPLSEMVVYLESPDPKRPMPPPSTQPVTVTQKDAQFQPKLAVVTVGQTVEFPNEEDKNIEHNVFSNSPAKRFDLGLYGAGKSQSVTFDKPGPVLLYCSIHRYMDGVVFVSPTPYTSLVTREGRYEIKDVPPGKWTLRTWQRRRRFPEKTMPIEVAADKPTTIDMELKRK
jgi:plastocyanin